ncbi:hypothetical protein NVI2019_PEGOAJLN_00702 [Providencia alcalifaciens]|nr:hypothetical protein NVI2019_PEGOAJLN_00702 [Providencia alcalifaciens]
MNWKLSVFTFLGVIALGGGLNWLVSENQKLVSENKSLKSDLSSQIAITEDYEKRINSLHELDINHTKELTNAKAEINKLRNDVRNGTKRVYINAECSKSEANSTESGGNESTARFSDAVEQDYWRLIDMMMENERQTVYLQSYIRAECLR